MNKKSKKPKIVQKKRKKRKTRRKPYPKKTGTFFSNATLLRADIIMQCNLYHNTVINAMHFTKISSSKMKTDASFV